MGTVVNLQQYIDKKISRIEAYSLMELILDPKKKKEYDKHFNQSYKYLEEDDFSKKMPQKLD